MDDCDEVSYFLCPHVLWCSRKDGSEANDSLRLSLRAPLSRMNSLLVSTREHISVVSHQTYAPSLEVDICYC